MAAVDAMADGFALFDAQDRLVAHNRRFLELFPLLEPLGDLHGLSFFALASVPDGASHEPRGDDAIAERMRRHAAADGEPFDIPLQTGGWVQVRENRTPDGGTICVWSDITRLKAAEAQLLEAIDGVGEGFVLLDTDERILLANDGMRRRFAEAGVEIAVGGTLSERIAEARRRGMFADEVDAAFADTFLTQFRETGEQRVEVPLRDGHWMLASLRRIGTGCAVGIWTDLTAQKRRESELITMREQLRQQSEALAEFARLVALQARSDLLTGLPNRFALEERLNQYLRDGEPRSLWVGMIDIDHFKGVNDAVGHAAADEVLRELSHVLRAQLRSDDMLARVGGDEFALVLSNIEESDALRIARRLNTTVRESPFHVSGRAFTLGLSIGLVRGNGNAKTVSSLIAAADTACYVAKESGRDRVQLYDLGDPKVSNTRQRLSWAERIRLGFELGRFHLHLQAIVDADLQPLGYEALIRLVDENGTYCQPAEFLPAAQRLGLMGRIDSWVCRHVMDLAIHLIERGAGHYVSANIGARSLTDPAFQRSLMDLLDLHPGVESAFRIEVTESEGIEDIAEIARFLSDLRGRGIYVYLDDFGNGYNSFEALKRLPVDGIKIDWSVTRDLLSDPIDKALMMAAISIARSLGLELVAEGVEEEIQLTKLRELGAMMYQGFLFHRPTDAQDLLAKGSLAEDLPTKDLPTEDPLAAHQ
ncbi:diguanylate cyclase (GGDEF)-like protein [Angulomicrobium tetraedrale]|uniref:Diguanylate cyclase (GGDEF)-like protein n=1 Tax=Ancylobacter tetraedralis TaxID=217068 RepID=A0A839Z593_9HYPH|nr:EAL domain-containing protein [Ancylobacter tetraedralis]MBB3769670.1 diguanylate cyclase (GGDEF)-like protein [Ancylobacter tetraedralis]